MSETPAPTTDDVIDAPATAEAAQTPEPTAAPESTQAPSETVGHSEEPATPQKQTKGAAKTEEQPEETPTADLDEAASEEPTADDVDTTLHIAQI